MMPLNIVSFPSGKLTALRLFNKFQVSRGYPIFKDINEEVIKADNLQHNISRFGTWLASFSIPKYYNADFKVRSSMVGKAIEYLSPDAKKKYFERVKACLKWKFPSHPDWAVEKDWWESLLKSFETEALRESKLTTVDNKDKDKTIRPLYKQNDPDKLPFSRDLAMYNCIKDIDLESICIKVRTNHCITILLLFIFL